MNLELDAAHLAFQAQVHGFLEGERGRWPKPGAGRPELLAWQTLLIEQGYAARTIPRAYGGYGAEPDILNHRIIAEAFTAAGAPGALSGQGISMLVPTLLELGTEEQKQQWIAPTLAGQVVWCQGYSEPGAGSDLASLRTSATEDGDDFVISGSKIWTSTAAQADMIFALVRTEPDAPKHAGISYLIFSMKTPGIEVRPLIDMTGAAGFNEVFFTDVRVPRSQIVAGRGEGWMVANATLKHERGMLGDPNAAEQRLAAIIDLMREETVYGERLIDNPLLRDRLMRLQGEVLAMKFNGLRLLTAALNGEPPGLAALVVKLRGCELNHQLAALAIDALGELGVLYDGSPHLRAHGVWQQRYMFDLGLIIGGGTAQIQKSIIAERGLGMPREPKLVGGLMDFALTADQTLMQASANGVLDRVCPLGRVRAFADGAEPYAADVWTALTDLGVPGLMIGEAHGGLGLTLLDAALVAESLGAHVAPTPFLSSAVLAPLALTLAGSPAQQDEWLPKLATGEITVGIAINEAVAGARDGAGVRAQDGRLSGRSLFALDAAGAVLVIVADDVGGLHLVAVPDARMEITPLATIDRTRRVSELAFDDVFAEPLPGAGAALNTLRDAAWVMLAADMLGASGAMIAQAVAYAQERRQFGRVIGSFQAVKHMCAEMAAHLEPCRALVWYAADAAPDEAPLVAAHAKALLSEVSRFVARTATEVHGGMGFTDLLGLHYWFKRVGLGRQLLGGPERVRLAAARIQGFAA